jgi:hypothetical protein
MSLRFHVVRPVLVCLVALLGACGGGDKTPSAPVTPPPTTQPPLATMPPAPVLSESCVRIGASPASGKEKCGADHPQFLDQLDDAINELVHTHPELFDLNDIRGAGGYRVLSEGAVWVGVIKNLDKQGLCAGQYSEEMAIKENNNYSDNYDILTADSHLRRGLSSYRSTCAPASFTSGVPPAGTNPGCDLAYSRAIACSREVGNIKFLNQVMAAIDKVAKDHPEWFDFTQHAPGSDWYKVVNTDAYTKGVVANLLAMGLCARWDGEEINVKNTNDWSENYDILTADNYVRKGEGSYRVTCYPAYF